MCGAQHIWGPQRPGALLPYDANLARIYLSQAAIQGRLEAMQAMAAPELRTGHPLAARVWAETPADCQHRLDPGQMRIQGCLPELIHMAQSALDARQSAQVLTDVNGVPEEYGPGIDASLRRHAQAWSITKACPIPRIASTETKTYGFVPDPGDSYLHSYPMTALYAVDPAGHIAGNLRINALPDWKVHDEPSFTAQQLRFKPTSGCGQARLVTQHLEFGDRRCAMRWN